MKTLAQESSWLERIDAALFSGLKKEAFGGGRRLAPIRLDQRTVVTTAGAAVFKRSHCSKNLRKRRKNQNL